MKPLSVKHMRTILAGELIQGSDDVMIHNGAYRLDQVKKRHTIFFSRKRIVDWGNLKKFFPLVLVTDQEISLKEDLKDLTVIKVEDTEMAYWHFVNFYRSQFDIPVIAVTGTAGKTTVKEMIKHILSFNNNVVATKNSKNTRTVHLQYLLSIDDQTEAAVFETAVGAPGDMEIAGAYFKPTIGIITNIGAHHLGLCKTLDSYIKEKGNMAKILDQNGILIINTDDVNIGKIDLKPFYGRIIKVGKDSSCHFRATDIQFQKDGMQFQLQHEEQRYSIFVPGLGEHQVYNALAALAAVHEIGVNLSEAADRLKTFKKFDRQLQVIEGINGSTLLDDTWSLTSTSLEAALKVLKEFGKDKKKIAVIGSIKGLGAWGSTIHKQAGEMIATHEVDILITIGILARIIADYAENSNLNLQVYSFEHTIPAYYLLKRLADEETIILVKGDMYTKPIIELAAKIRKEQ